MNLFICFLPPRYNYKSPVSSQNLSIEILTDTTIQINASGNDTVRYYQRGINRINDTTETTRVETLSTGENFVFNFKTFLFVVKPITEGLSVYETLIATNTHGSIAVIARQTHLATPANFSAGSLFWYDKRAKSRTRTTSPIGALTPLSIGEEILDTVAGIWYKSHGTTSADWKAMT